ncbi:hypothetical protein HS1_001366 [Candidatus Desulfofervidus auxilii]|uniref:Uncharacterized protein n=1 Tax=Desulfofervidus auxilii TaxID=1621989 RepID=A0A7U4THS3_DESA2|nr:hypothetical protein [Candidatus Desulfofervidus auxilii]AMM41169.1 hypothetical protein HS1_001366 [Candidatus Desulfofervidus auxilii]CAD7778100.1 hypothetical protein DMNBHIDG_01680 [Candidatus Methanoperedenaceae archaeon GB37]
MNLGKVMFCPLNTLPKGYEKHQIKIIPACWQTGAGSYITWQAELCILVGWAYNRYT